MVRCPSALLAALLLCSSGASASAAGFNLSWDDCGANGTPLATFACNTNIGTRDLIISVVVPDDIPQVVGVEGVLFLSVGPGQVLPDWWSLANAECRANGMTFILENPTDPSTCEYIFGTTTDAAGGMAWDSQYLGTPELARIRFIAATPVSHPIIAGVEYTVGRLRLNMGRTTLCSGCSMPACIHVASVNVVQPAGVGNVLLTTAESQNDVGWQCPAIATTGGCFFDCATSATRPTWGSIKLLYR